VITTVFPRCVRKTRRDHETQPICPATPASRRSRTGPRIRRERRQRPQRRCQDRTRERERAGAPVRMPGLAPRRGLRPASHQQPQQAALPAKCASGPARSAPAGSASGRPQHGKEAQSQRRPQAGQAAQAGQAQARHERQSRVLALSVMSGLKSIGMQVTNPGSGTLTLAVDALSWTR
jgi:hypothetical protein